MKNLPRCARICKGIGAEIGQSEQLMLLFPFLLVSRKIEFRARSKSDNFCDWKECHVDSR